MGTQFVKIQKAVTLKPVSSKRWWKNPRDLWSGHCWRNQTELTQRPVGNQRDSECNTKLLHSHNVQPQRAADRSLKVSKVKVGTLGEWQRQGARGFSPWKWAEIAALPAQRSWWLVFAKRFPKLTTDIYSFFNICQKPLSLRTSRRSNRICS